MDDDERKETGRRVAAARIRAGLGKEGAARKAGVSSITWKKVEDGERVLDVSLHAVLRAVGLDSPETTEAPVELHQVADAELLAEIARRFTRTTTKEGREDDAHQSAPSTRAGVSPADVTREESVEVDPVPGAPGRPRGQGRRPKRQSG